MLPPSQCSLPSLLKKEIIQKEKLKEQKQKPKKKKEKEKNTKKKPEGVREVNDGHEQPLF